MRGRNVAIGGLLLLFGALNLGAFDSEPLWRRALGGEIDAYPAQGPGGDVYVVADDRALHSLDPLSGEARWIYRPGGRLRNLLLVAPDGTVYVQNDRQELFAVSPGGSGRWKLKMNAEAAALPAASPDGRLILALTGGRVVCVSRHGVLLWSRDDSAEASAAPVVDLEGRIWLPLSDGRILGLDSWGEEIAELRGAGPVSVLAMDASGRLWAGGFSGTVAVFDVDAGEAPGAADLNDVPLFLEKPVSSRVSAILTSAADTGEVFFADGTAVKFSADGALLDSRRIAVSGGSPSKSGSDTLYFPASDGSLRVIDSSGIETELRGRSVLAEPLLTDEGILISGGGDWILYAWTAESPGPGWRQFRGGPRRSGTFPTDPADYDRQEARKDPGFFFREQMALSEDVSERLALIRELESFEREMDMYRELPWASLLLEDLAAVGTLRRVDSGNEPLISHAIARERAYRLLGRSEDFRNRDLLHQCLRNEKDLRALGAGFRALGQLGTDWDGASLRLIAAAYRGVGDPDDQFTLETARALEDLVRYNGEITDRSGYGLMDSLLHKAGGRQTREEVISIIRRISGL